MSHSLHSAVRFTTCNEVEPNEHVHDSGTCQMCKLSLITSNVAVSSLQSVHTVVFFSLDKTQQVLLGSSNGRALLHAIDCRAAALQDISCY